MVRCDHDDPIAAKTVIVAVDREYGPMFGSNLGRGRGDVAAELVFGESGLQQGSVLRLHIGHVVRNSIAAEAGYHLFDRNVEIVAVVIPIAGCSAYWCSRRRCRLSGSGCRGSGHNHLDMLNEITIGADRGRRRQAACITLQ